LSIYTELSRRNVFRVGIAYVVASWVLLQIVDVIIPIFEVPDWAPKLIFVILAVGLVPALIFAWAFEMTPEGLKKESEVDRSASIVGTTGNRSARVGGRERGNTGRNIDRRSALREHEFRYGTGILFRWHYRRNS